MAPGAREIQEDNYGITRADPNHDRDSESRVRGFFERADRSPLQRQSALSARCLSGGHSGIQAVGVCPLALPAGPPAKLSRDHDACAKVGEEWGRTFSVVYCPRRD